jgi:carboxyl-terminal processing protease
VLQTRVIEQYLKRQDSAKIYLLDADVVQVKAMMKNLFDDLGKTNCKFLSEIQSLLVKRVEERTEYVKTLIGKDFKFNKETEFVYDPDHKEFGKTSEEANEFIKKYVQFQIANYLATDVKMDEAKKRVVKNYERNLKRIKETKSDTLIANYLNSFALALDFLIAFNLKLNLFCFCLSWYSTKCHCILSYCF